LATLSTPAAIQAMAALRGAETIGRPLGSAPSWIALPRSPAAIRGREKEGRSRR